MRLRCDETNSFLFSVSGEADVELSYSVWLHGGDQPKQVRAYCSYGGGGSLILLGNDSDKFVV